MKFHHLGIATDNLEKAKEWIATHFKITAQSDKVFDPKQNATLQLVHTRDQTFEIVTGKMVKNLVAKKITYYHICYEVDDITKSIEEMDGLLISPPTEAILFNNRLVAFLLTPIGIVELLESEK